MSEQVRKKSPEFVFPRMLGMGMGQTEIGEIERVAKHVGEPEEIFVPRFLQATLPKENKAHLVELDEDVWSQLQNTASYDIAKGEWDKVRNIIGDKRDWEGYRRRMENGQRIDAPIIVKLPGEYHKVSGNTRLMVACALGITPKVLIVDLT